MAPDAERLTPSPETLARIADYYAEDFRRFGYTPDDTASSEAQPAAPKGLMTRLVGALSGGRT